MQHQIAVIATLAVLFVPPAGGARRARRIAVMEFANDSRDKGWDWFGRGIRETLTTQLSQIPDLVVVERSRLGDAQKEIKLDHSQLVDPSTAQRMGKFMGAQSVVVGSYQTVEDKMRIYARLVDVETGEVRAPAQVDGAAGKVLDLENELAKRLVTEMKGTLDDYDRKQLESAPTGSLEAYRLFSDGVYFLRNDLVDDALTQFDKAIEADQNYGEAWFYKGLALEKLERWDDAIAALKRALPRSQPVRAVKWSWDAPYENEKAEHARMRVLDLAQAAKLEQEDSVFRVSQRLVYGERLGKQTVLHLLDLKQRTAQKMIIDDPRLILNPVCEGSDNLVLLLSGEPLRDPKVNLVSIDFASQTIGRTGLDLSRGLIFHFLLGSTLVVGSPSDGWWLGVDPATLKPRWRRDKIFLAADSLELGATAKLGDIVVFRSEQKLHGARLETGEDLWVADLQSSEITTEIRDNDVAVMEHGRRVAILDLETGARRAEVPVQPGTVLRDTSLGNVAETPHLIRNRVLYLWTKDKTLCAVDLRPGVANRILWRSPVARAPRSMEMSGETVLVGTDTGELLWLDARTGAIANRFKVGEKNATIGYASDQLLIAGASDGVVAIDGASREKKWAFASKFASKAPFYFKGVVVVRTGDHELSILNADTGSPLWQYSGKRVPWVHTTDDGLFVAEENGVKEYTLEKTASRGLTEKEVFTELARTYFEKGSLKEAAWQVGKVVREMDADYPPARYLQAQILKAQGDRKAAAREWLAYLNLESADTPRGREVVAELTKNHGLLWRTDLDLGPPIPEVVDEKVVSTGAVWADDPQISARDAKTGGIAWRHRGQRFIYSVLEPESRRLFYLTGERDDPQAAHVYSIDPATGEERRLATLKLPKPVSGVEFSAAGPNLYVLLTASEPSAEKQLIRIAAVRAADGNVLWQKDEQRSFYKAGGFLQARPDRLIYSLDREIYIVNAADGEMYGYLAEPQTVIPSFQPRNSGDWLYWVNADKLLTAYDLPKKQRAWSFQPPDLGANRFLCTCRTSAAALFDYDQQGVFAVNLQPDTAAPQRILWRKEMQGKKIESLLLRRDRLFVYQDDETLLELDPATGKTLAESPFLFQPDYADIVGDVAYVFTNGQGYALKLSK